MKDVNRTAILQVDDDEIFDIVRRNYATANEDYIAEQIAIASQYLPKPNTDDETKKC